MPRPLRVNSAPWVTGDWYRALFPNMRLPKDSETECVTTKGGGRFAVPVGGSFTGRGADVIIIDDPMKAGDAQSESARRAVNDCYGTTLLSRLDDKGKGAIILVAQRLHRGRPCGQTAERMVAWHHLDLPAIAQEDQEIAIGPGIIHRRSKGDVLHPAREPLGVLEAIKREWARSPSRPNICNGRCHSKAISSKRNWIKW